MSTTKDRLPTASNTTEGALTGTLARISYVADYYDAADRLTAEEDVGTNGGTVRTRPSSPDSSDNTHLVTSFGYDAAGNLNLTTDPRGIVGKTIYDMLGRTTETIAAYTNGTPTDDTNQKTDYTYDGIGDILTMTAVMPSETPSQTTAYIYGVGVSGGLYSNDLVAGVQYPDATTGYASASSSDDVSYGYDDQGETTAMIDQNGTTHTYTYDVLGRLTLDSVAVASMNPQNVDTSVLSLGYSYNTQGLPYQQTSYANANGTSVVNQDQDVYNGLGQLTGEYQSTSGAVNTSTTAEVQYIYSSVASGSLPTEMVYPNGRILHFGYDNNTLDTAIGRVDYLADDNGSGAAGSHLADYGYLGLGSILSQADGNGVTLTTSLDQFGRIAEMNYVKSGTSTDDFQYAYDRDGNVLYKKNILNSTFDELYHANSTTTGDDNSAYDPLNRLTGFTRGTLSSSGHNGSGLDTVATTNTLAGSSQSFTLDAIGNQTDTTTDGTPTSKTQNSKNELTGVGANALTYDNNGNTTADENGNTLTYDAWNRMVTDSAGTTSYTFDANGRRITETHSATTTNLYFSSAGQVIEERQSGTVTNQYVWNLDYVNDLLLRDDNSTSGNLGISGSGLGRRIYLQHDANFNTTALVSDVGSVLERVVMTPYGQQTVLSASWVATSDAYNWLYYFQGGRIDLATGLLHFGTPGRDYDPSTGTWKEADGGYWDGMSLYQAFDSSPAGKSDPTGQQAEEDIEEGREDVETMERLEREMDKQRAREEALRERTPEEEAAREAWRRQFGYYPEAPPPIEEPPSFKDFDECLRHQYEENHKEELERERAANEKAWEEKVKGEREELARAEEHRKSIEESNEQCKKDGLGPPIIGEQSDLSLGDPPEIEKLPPIEIPPLNLTLFPETPEGYTSSPSLPEDPYNPRNVDLRRSNLRRGLDTGNLDPDSEIPDQGAGENIKGAHSAGEDMGHQGGERNVNPSEEHCRVSKGSGGGQGTH